MKTELLAPAKDLDTAIAAIDCGADAVYIGASAFGARSKAVNSIIDIKKIVNYAHKFYAKIYVTLNIILKDNELSDVINLINDLYKINVDGLIIQDMAIVKLASENKIPPIPLHISTQCNNRDVEKIRFYDNIGIGRVVLARELSLNEIKNIKKQTNIELECFIHGALCVSYSGQCYLSHSIGNRSANRGECAQPCRKKYSLIDEKGNFIIKNKHLLSLKDFNTTDYVKDLVDAGITSYKIEGRMKDINYVKNVVMHYRKELDKYSDKTSSGKVYTDFVPDINKTFNREYTNYFLNGRSKCFNFDTPKFKGEYIGKIIKISNSYFITDTKLIVNKQDGLCFMDDASIGCIVNKTENNKIYPNKMPDIKIGMKVYRNIDAEFGNKLNSANIKRKINADINITNSKISITDEDKNTVSAPINSNEIAKNKDKIIETYKKQLSKTGESDFVINNIKITEDVPFLPIAEINKLRRELLDKLMSERIKNYKQKKQKQIKLQKYYKFEDDYHSNVSNNIAKDFYRMCDCNITQPAYEIKKQNNIELMRTKHCIKYALDMCKSDKKLYLIDEYNKKYELKFDCKNCEMVILG